MKKIRVGIIGQGRSGRGIHGQYLYKAGKYEIVAASDIIKQRCERAKKEYGCETYADYKDLLKRTDMDLVVNALPSHMHVPVTREILNAGFDVLCEKPLARNTREVDALMETAKKKKKVLAIYQQSRYAPYFQQIKKVIKSGVLGDIIQISIAFNGFARRWDWQTIHEYYGGSLLNTGPHPLDQALNLMDTPGMPDVKCFMDRVNSAGDAEDYVKLILSAPGKPVIDLEISSCCAYPSFTYNIQAGRGGLKSDMKHVEWKYFRASEMPRIRLQRKPISQPDGTPGFCTENIKWHEKSWNVPERQKDLFNTMAAAFYNMLYKTLTKGAALEITPHQVRQQIAVIDVCHRQNRKKLKQK